MLRAAIVSAALALGSLGGAAAADEMTVVGEGKVSAVPDVATVRLGVTSVAATAQAALEDNSRATAAVMDVAREAGVAQSDIGTANFRVAPRYDNSYSDGAAPRIAGYEVTNEVAVTLREVDRLGALIDAAIRAGANTVNNVEFGFADPGALQNEARRQAVADAIARAELYAAAAGITLGRLAAVTDVPVAVQPAPGGATRAMAVPIASGTSEIAARVVLTFAIGE